MEKQYVSFSIDGEGITNIAREWLFVSHRGYAKAEELILECMKGTEHTEEELKIMARRVILGFATFIGNSRDGTLVYDDELLSDVTPLIDNIINKYEKLKEEYHNLSEKYDELIDEIEDNGMMNDFHTLNPMAKEKVNYGSNTMLESYIKAIKFDDNYGWLEPSGEFHIVDWCQHQEWAKEFILKKGWLTKIEVLDIVGKEGDYLAERGWVLLHNPSQGIGIVTKTQPLTSKQREFLFAYYSDRGEEIEARKYFDEEL